MSPPVTFTGGFAGNAERLAFLYNPDRVQPSSLVWEIVLPPIGADPVQQFARTPYFAGCTRAGTEFILASVRMLWGKTAARRLPEATAFAQWMREWADRDTDWNLDCIGDPFYAAIVATALRPLAELNKVPRTIFDDDNTNHFYDQIAWFSETDGPRSCRTWPTPRRPGPSTSSPTS